MRQVLAMAAAAGLLLAGAPAAAEYRPAKGDGPGFAERLVGDQAVVTYRGDKENKTTVARWAMRRAAELTLANGFEWFLVSDVQSREIERGTDTLNRADTSVNDRSAGASSSAVGQADPIRAATNGASVDNQGGSPVNPGLVERRRRRPGYETTLTIRMGRGRQVAVENPQQPQEIFDAAAVAKQYAGTR